MEQRTNETLNPPKVFRAGRSTWIVFCTIATLVSGICIFMVVTHTSNWVGLAVGVAFYAIMVYLVAMEKIELSPRGIAYTRAFKSRRFIAWPKISNVGIECFASDAQPPMCLTFHDHSGASRLGINIKMFNREDLVQLAGIILAQAPHAHAPDLQEMVQNSMPSIVKGWDRQTGDESQHTPEP